MSWSLNEKQKRLLYLAGSTGAITMTVIGIAAIMTLGASGSHNYGAWNSSFG